MLLLIDGYNLLHHSDLLLRGRGEGWLLRARRRLIGQLAKHLDATLAAQTALVFDARDPPPDRPDRARVASMRVFYAVGYPEADDLIEELIARHPAPRRLTVVSSDHRLQRAGRRRGATSFDADIWYDALLASGPRLGILWPPRESEPLSADERLAGEKPEEPVSDAEVAEWFELFALDPPPSPPATPTPPATPPAKPTPKPKPASKVERPAPRRRRATPPRNPHRPLDPDKENPFPEGYGEEG